MKREKRIGSLRRRAGYVRPLVGRLVLPVRERSLLDAARRYPAYLRDLRSYQRLGGELSLADLNPKLFDRDPVHPLEPHYFFQGVWAARHLAQAAPPWHVDVASHLPLIGVLTAIVPITYVEYRPVGLRLRDFSERPGTVTALPFEDMSVLSLSCLHVAEHVGLGRYGDELDPNGTEKAAKELERVLAASGTLYFTVPVGRPRTEFNAHRVHQAADVARMFPALQLEEFSLVDDEGAFHENVGPAKADGQHGALGMFRFVRRSQPV